MGREMDGDDEMGGAFKRPGSVPFRWEETPGVPKLRLHNSESDHGRHHQSLPNTPRKLAPPPCFFINTNTSPLNLPRTQSSRSFIWSRSDTRQKSTRQPLQKPQQQTTNNNTSLTRRPTVVSSTTNCILSPLLRRKWGTAVGGGGGKNKTKKNSKKKGEVVVAETQHQQQQHHRDQSSSSSLSLFDEPVGYTSDVGGRSSSATLTRWSVSARKTLSSLWDHQSSSSSSSISSRRSSPRSSSRDHPEMAGFGLF